MILVDTHCHIQSSATSAKKDHTAELWQKSNQTTDELVSNALMANVKKMICVGCDLEDSYAAVAFAADRDSVYASIGIHPHESTDFLSNAKNKEQFIELLEGISNKKIVAIGECGLDYFYNHSIAEDQKETLRFQLDFAAKYDRPVIFHVREAFDDFWPIFDSYRGNIRGVLHSFTDSIETLEKAIDRGLYIGVNGIATFTKSNIQLEMFKKIPIDRLLLETDAPYLTPTPYRGTINEPKHILTIAKFAAELRGEDIQYIAETTTTNSHLLFGI